MEVEEEEEESGRGVMDLYWRGRGERLAAARNDVTHVDVGGGFNWPA